MPIVDEKFLRTLYTKEQFEDVLYFLKDEIQKRFPQWTAHNDDDFGSVLLELFAGIVDMFRFYQNVTAVEAFPCLARLRESLVRHAKWFGYTPKPAGAARTTLEFTVEDPLKGALIPRGTQVATQDGQIVFETVEELAIGVGRTSGRVGAVHAHLVEKETLGVSNGRKNQRFPLRRKPLVVLTTAEPHPLPAVRVFVDGEEWQNVRSLAWASSLGDRVGKAFKVEIEADDTAYVVFGDGIFGDIPKTGAVITAEYWVGGGKHGNVGKGMLTRLLSDVPNIKSVTNVEPAVGGSDRESEEELRRNIPSQVVTRGRAVTREDYKRLLEAFAEVEKVNVRHRDKNIVEVYVYPAGGGQLTEELAAKLGAYLDDIRMITEDVRILPAKAVPVAITAMVWYAAGYEGTEVSTKAEKTLRDLFKEVEFGRQLYPSDIYKALLSVDGVAKVDVDLLARAEGTGVNPILAAEDEVLVPGPITVQAVPLG